MGGRAVDANEVFFNNYTIPSSSLIGLKNKGFKIILHGMNAECCLLAGEALGLGYAALSRQYPTPKPGSCLNDRLVIHLPMRT